ncbi:MAG: hypothetical protein KF745_04190 [Phycisphaeraceae bacterium]|nr:hypothetical protein [Phycisphaeraceae bacterium]
MRSGMCVLALLVAAGSPAMAQLVDTRVDTTPGGATVDQVISPNEYGPGNAYSYTGGGSGFGGTVGGGTLYMNSDATNLYIGFNAGGAMNDLITIMLDTRAGGFTDAQMDDQGDGARRASSNLNGGGDDVMGILPDFSLVFASWGTVMFELNAGNTPNHLNFVAFDGGGSQPVREYAIPLATLGVLPGGNIDFFVAYIADSGYGSNESIPAQAFNAGPNIGFDPPPASGYSAYDRFTTVPTPGAAALLGLGGLLVARRRR